MLLQDDRNDVLYAIKEISRGMFPIADVEVWRKSGFLPLHNTQISVHVLVEWALGLEDLPPLVWTGSSQEIRRHLRQTNLFPRVWTRFAGISFFFNQMQIS